MQVVNAGFIAVVKSYSGSDVKPCSNLMKKAWYVKNSCWNFMLLLSDKVQKFLNV